VALGLNILVYSAYWRGSLDVDFEGGKMPLSIVVEKRSRM